MSDVTMEQRLKLLKQIRSRYNEDQYDLSNRERILYGKTSRPVESLERKTETAAEGENQVSSFRIRIFLAILLFAAVIAMDRNGTEVAGITAKEIFQAISADYETEVDRWAEALSAETDGPNVDSNNAAGPR